jgi:TonB family protein
MKLRITVFLIWSLSLAMLAQNNAPVKSADTPNKVLTRDAWDGLIVPMPGNYPVVDYPKGLPTPLLGGTVSLSATVNEHGKVDSVVIVHPVNPELNAAAIAAVSHWRFRPATKDGMPITTQVSVDVVFTGPHPYTVINGIDRLHVGGVTAPRLTYDPDPEYTDAARKAKTEGTVVLGLVVSAAGLPEYINVVRSLDSGLDKAAVDAVKQWKFEPAMKGDKPVAIHINVEVNFKAH